LRSFSIIFNGSLVVSVVISWVLLWIIFAFPAIIRTVVLGAKPMKEYCASFSGPSMDSKRYAFSKCFWSFEKISMGLCVGVICLIFRGLTGWAVVDVVPKAIPH